MTQEGEGRQTLTTIILLGGVPLHQFKGEEVPDDGRVLAKAQERKFAVNICPIAALNLGLPEGEIRRYNLTRMSDEEVSTFLRGDWRMLVLKKIFIHHASQLLDKLSILPPLLRFVRGSTGM